MQTCEYFTKVAKSPAYVKQASFTQVYVLTILKCCSLNYILLSLNHFILRPHIVSLLAIQSTNTFQMRLRVRLAVCGLLVSACVIQIRLQQPAISAKLILHSKAANFTKYPCNVSPFLCFPS